MISLTPSDEPFTFVDYLVYGPRTAAAVVSGKSRLRAAVISNGSGSPRYITSNLAGAMHQFASGHRVYHDASFALAVEVFNGLAVAASFDDMRIMLHLLERQPPPEISPPTGYPDRCDCVRTLYPELMRQLEAAQLRNVYDVVEKPAVTPTMIMTANGVRVDVPRLERFIEGQDRRLGAVQRRVRETAGRYVDVLSPEDVECCLFDELELEADKFTATERRSTQKTHLWKLADRHPAVAPIIECAELERLRKTAKRLLQHVGSNDLVHPDLDMLGACTGRYSCREPELQSLDKALRFAIRADENCVLLDADFSQAELRVLAHLSQDPELLRAFRENADIHRRTIAAALNKPEDQVTPADRDRGKTLNFQIVNGAGPQGIANELDIPRDDAARLLDNYFRTYAGVKAWMDHTRQTARTNGWVATPHGRRRHVNLFDGNGHGNCQAVNAPLQGGGAELIKLAVARLIDVLPGDARMLLTVHDSVLIQVPREMVAQVRPTIVEVMETQPTGFTVAIRVDVGGGNTWADCRGK